MAVITALLGAAGSVGGALLSRPRNRDGVATVGVQSSPLFQQLLLQSLMGVGAPINPAQVRSAGPLATLLGAAGTVGLKQKGQRGFASILDNLYSDIAAGREAGKSAAEIAADIRGSDWWNIGKGTRGGFLGDEEDIRQVMDPFGFFGDGISKSYKRTKRGKRALNRLSAASGYESLEELIQAQLDFESTADNFLADANEQGEVIRGGREDALRRIAEIQSGFVAPDEEEIESRRAEIEDILRAQISRDFGEREQAALYQANAQGINPAARLGRIDEARALANLAAGPDALARTLQLISGQQGVQSNALNALQGSLTSQTQLPLALLGLQSNNNVAMTNIASNQALALAQLDAQYRQNLGAGVQGAFNQLAQIPGIQAEQRRAEINNQISRNYGISTQLDDVMRRNPDIY